MFLVLTDWRTGYLSAGALRAFLKYALRIADRIDHGYVAIILFDRFIDQIENAFRTRKRAHDVVHLLGELADRHGELARVFQEGSDGAEID